MDIMLLCLSAGYFLYHKTHIFHALTVLCACGNDIDSGGVDTAVTENVRQLCNILFNAVKHTGKKVTKIVRKNLVWIDIGIPAKFLHVTPDICPADRLACACDEDTARRDIFLCRISE